MYVCVVCVVIRYILDFRLVDAPTGVGVTQEARPHRISHPPSFCLNFSRENDSAILSLVDREVEFCVTHELIVLGMIFILFFIFILCEEKSQFDVARTGILYYNGTVGFFPTYRRPSGLVYY